MQEKQFEDIISDVIRGDEQEWRMFSEYTHRHPLQSLQIDYILKITLNLLSGETPKPFKRTSVLCLRASTHLENAITKNEALALYKEASDLGHTRATVRYGMLCQDENPQLAEQLYNKAAKQGNKGALNRLGMLYEDHFSNKEMAIHYYAQAAELGDSNACNNLAIIYHDAMDFRLAGQFYLKAIALGNVPAMYNYALLQMEDHLLNIPKAMKYFHMAAAQGLGDAQQWLSEVNQKGHFAAVESQPQTRQKFFTAAQNIESEVKLEQGPLPKRVRFG